MREYPLVLERLLDTPLLAHPEKARVVAGVVLARQGVEVNVAASARFTAAKAGPLQERRMTEGREREPYMFDPGSGIAVIPVSGSLAHRVGYIGKSSGVMGYDGIAAAFGHAMDNPSVRGVMLDIHSPGGEVHGAFQLADRIAAARGAKPVIAMVDEMAYSAGYMLAAACEEVWLAADTAGVGSIGAVVVHASYQQMLESEGIKVTIIKFGARKADGNPFEDLPAEARDAAQARIDTIGKAFVARVAAWRGVGAGKVRATEAGIFLGAEGVKAGLADGIAPPADVFDALAAKVNPGRMVRLVA